MMRHLAFPGLAVLAMTLGLGLSVVGDGRVSVPSIAAAAPDDGVALDPIGQALGVADYELTAIAVPAAPGAGFDVPVTLDGIPEVLELTPHSLRSPGFSVQVQQADGSWQRAIVGAPTTYRGRLASRPGSFIAATIRDGRLTATILDRARQRNWFVQPLASVDPGADGAVHVIYAGEDIEPGDAECACAAGALPGGFPGPVQSTAPVTLGALCIPQTKVAFDVDAEYFALNNSDVTETTADIEIIMNSVDLIFNVELGIAYEITEIKIRESEPDPYNATDPFLLIDEMVLEWQTNCIATVRDVAHLFTGKVLDGLVGLAAVGVVCEQDLAYGLSQSRFSTNIADRVALTAHEFGHNWGAFHCDLPPCPDDAPDCHPGCAIMCSNINGCFPSLTFGFPSSQQIQGYRLGISCLDIATDNTTLVFPAAARLRAEDAEINDFFGISIDVADTPDGQYAIVGANFHDIVRGTKKKPEITLDAGAAYIYRYDGVLRDWVLLQKLVAEDFEPFDRFGTAVAIDGEVAVVGAPLDDRKKVGSGSVYVYRRTGSTYAFEEKLTAENPVNSDQFGAAVDVDGDLIIVGVPGAGANAGAADVFQFSFSAWDLLERIQAEDGGTADEFGRTVAIFQDDTNDPLIPDRAIVGAFQANETIDKKKGKFVNDVGAAYVFERQFENMVQEAKLWPADREMCDEFGSSVAIGPNYAAVGAWKDDENGEDAGAVYIFSPDQVGNWNEQAKLMSPAPGNASRFGASVAIADDFVLVGAHRDDILGTNSGAGYGYSFLGDRKDMKAIGWEFIGRVASNPGEEGNQFGINVGADGHLGGVGSWFDDGPLMGQGSAEVFFIAGDCNDNGITDVCEIATGDVLDCNDNGVPDDCDIASGLGMDENGDGVLDECFVDCNGNLMDDILDIINGTSDDCNENGVPDECEAIDCNSNGISDICEVVDLPGSDCNFNGIPDDCDIDSGESEDCNGDNIPDECSTFVFLDSGVLSPIGDDSPQTWTVNGAPRADGDVTVRFIANADLDSSFEFFNVFVDGTDVGDVFRLGARQCPAESGFPDDDDQLVVSRTDWNIARDDGQVQIEIIPDNVDETQCTVPSSSVRVLIGYGGGDCNDNGIPDICDIIDGTSTDTNGNQVPDECECFEDLNGDFVVDVNDLLQIIGDWGVCFGCPGDINGDFVVDVNDLLAVIGAWGNCP